MRGLDTKARLQVTSFTEPVLDVSAIDALIEEARVCADTHRQVIMVVQGLEWLFSIRPGGFAVLRRFVAGVVETSDRVGWLVSADRPVWTYADRVVQLHDAFPERFLLDPLDVAGLKRAILSRHAMSGFRVRYRRPRGGLLTRLRLAFVRHYGQQDWEQRYFAMLHADSGGVLSDALHLWMASIHRVDAETETVVVGHIPHPPIRAIRKLDSDELITLRQVARQGRLSADEHAAQFRLERETSLAYLARLAHWSLLERDGQDTFRFKPELSGPLYRVLHEREMVG